MGTVFSSHDNHVRRQGHHRCCSTGADSSRRRRFRSGLSRHAQTTCALDLAAIAAIPIRHTVAEEEARSPAVPPRGDGAVEETNEAAYPSIQTRKGALRTV